MTLPVAFLSHWELPDLTYRRHCWMTPGRRGAWGTLRASASVWGARYVVVHHGLPGRRYRLVPPWRLVLLRHEPAAFDPRWPAGSVPSARFVRPAYQQEFASGDVPMVATWWINLDYDALVALPPPAKPRALSCIVSGKAELPGHRRRLAFLEALAGRGGALDVFGRGLEGRALGGAYRGPLERDTGFPSGRNCKYDGLRDYRYSLCMENSRERNYITEKVIDCWLAWTVPIYWGCPNLSDYYPREAFVAIDLDAPDAVDEVLRRAREPVDRATQAAVAEARHLALHRYSTWATVERLLSEGRAGP